MTMPGRFVFFMALIAAFLAYNRPGSARRRALLICALNALFIFHFFHLQPVVPVALAAYLALFFVLLKLIESSAGLARSILRNVTLAACVAVYLVAQYEFAHELTGRILGQTATLSYLTGIAGLSYITLRVWHLTVDLARGSLESVEGLPFVSYLAFFGTFMAGPIDRYERFASDLKSARPIDHRETYEALYRFTTGAFKKMVIANPLAALDLTSPGVAGNPGLGRPRILLAAYIYTVALYFDFSGYSDMAIGIARLFGIRLPENFNRPYLARNLQEFWSRWHMSFISWLREYVFFPALRGLRAAGVSRIPIATAGAALLAFLVAGCWHGEGLNFALYGAYHWAGLMIFFAYRICLRRWCPARALRWLERSTLVSVASRGLTWHFVVGGWFLFLNLPGWWSAHA